MNKWKITSLVSLIAVMSLSAALGWQFLNTPSEKTETQEPSNGDTQPSNGESQVIEKPKFHIYDVEIGKNRRGIDFTSNDMNPTISFKMQNVGNVSATNVKVNFTVKLGTVEMEFNGQELVEWINGDFIWNLTIIPFVWVNDTLTINLIESKKTDEYFVGDTNSYFLDAGVTGCEGPGLISGEIVILESHWIVTCAEQVTETFDF